MMYLVGHRFFYSYFDVLFFMSFFGCSLFRFVVLSLFMYLCIDLFIYADMYYLRSFVCLSYFIVISFCVYMFIRLCLSLCFVRRVFV